MKVRLTGKDAQPIHEVNVLVGFSAMPGLPETVSEASRFKSRTNDLLPEKESGCPRILIFSESPRA